MEKCARCERESVPALILRRHGKDEFLCPECAIEWLEGEEELSSEPPLTIYFLTTKESRARLRKARKFDELKIVYHK